jgi:hypothetical protein
MVEMRTLSFDEQVAALRERGLDIATELRGPGASPPRSVLTLSRDVVSVATAAARVMRQGKKVVLGHLELAELDGFTPIASVELPDAPAYFAVDVDLGTGTRGVAPEQALRDIRAAGRSPLTLDEGIALVLQQPDVIATNWGFSMAGSRRGDQRVPAFWISDGRPKLGWCWDRNPHSWLGTASCAQRMAAVHP